MKRFLPFLALPLLSAVLPLALGARNAEKAGPKLAHMVFFTLKDHSKESRDRFVASCQKNLATIEGTVYFSVGVYADDVEEPGVSVKDFDVALHVVFEDKAAKEAYLIHPQHKRFVEENRENFEKVRVFDSYLSEAK